jgi:hypothetical protein
MGALTKTNHLKIIAGALGILALATAPALSGGNSSRPTALSPILVEIWLSDAGRQDAKAIQESFASVLISRVRFQFFRAGHPPKNIAIGWNVPAPIARLGIELAIRYNRGVQYLIPEAVLPKDYIAIGTSAFDEPLQIPVSPENLKKLADPRLTTTQFHNLYREIAKVPSRIY